MKRVLILAVLIATIVPATAEAHRYDRWGRATLNDFNYAVAWLCGGGGMVCEQRKTEANIAVLAATDHTWVTRTKYDSGGTSNWTHIESHFWFGNRVRCYTVAYSYHGQLVGIDRGGALPYEFCDPI